MAKVLFRLLRAPRPSVGPIQSRTSEFQRVSKRVLDAVAGTGEPDPMDVDRPLYDVIDPDALDTLFQSTEAGVHAEFPCREYDVTVRPDGDINLGPPHE